MMSVHLATLEELEYINLLTKEPELEYIFKHPMVQEVSYNSLPKKNRRQLHGQVAALIQEILADRLEEFTDLIAHHYTNSDQKDKAVEWLEKAGIHAKDRDANDEAIKYFEKLISFIENLSDISDRHKWIQLKAYETLGDITAIRGAYDRSIEAYRVMVEISDDIIVHARAQRKIARVYWHQSIFQDALDTLDKALKILTGKTDDVLIEQAEIFLLRAAVQEILGAMPEAQQAAEKALSIVEKIGVNNRVKKIRATAFISLGAIYRN